MSRIQVNQVGEVTVILLDRPSVRNAVDRETAYALRDAFQAFEDSDGQRVAVLGAVGTSFCAGYDLQSLPEQATVEEVRAWVEGPHGPMGPTRMELRKPVIAAINGHAVGIGLTLALQCDIRIVARDAKLSFPFVRLGIVPELGSTSILPSIAGMSNALDLMLSGRRFSGEDAVHYGLASEAVDASKVLEKAREWAIDVARNAAPVAVAVTKRLIWEGVDSTPAEASAKERELLSWLGKQPDAAEGVKSFLERREPEWKLRVSEDLPDQ